MYFITLFTFQDLKEVLTAVHHTEETLQPEAQPHCAIISSSIAEAAEAVIMLPLQTKAQAVQTDGAQITTSLLPGL